MINLRHEESTYQTIQYPNYKSNQGRKPYLMRRLTLSNLIPRLVSITSSRAMNVSLLLALSNVIHPI